MLRLCLVLAAVVIGLIMGCGDPARGATAATEKAPSSDAVREERDQALFPEKAKAVLEAIQQRHGKPLPGYVGGRVFHNREHRLPPGHYREYDVNPRRDGRHRGPERIVIEQRSGKAYYTGDHYETFVPMN